MRRLLASTGLALSFCACGGEQQPRTPPLPALPPLSLQPFLPTLKAIAAAQKQPTEAEQRELRELGDLALLLVEADVRTATRAERALLEHPLAWWVLEPALQHEQVSTRRRAVWLCGQSGQSMLQLALLLRLKYEADPETVLWTADALQRLGNDAGLAWLDAAMDHQATANQAGQLAIDVCRERSITLSESPTWAELQGKLRELGSQWRQTGIGSRANVTAPDEAQLRARVAAHLAVTEGTLLRPVDDARFVLTRAGRLAVPLLTSTLAASEPYLRTMALQVLAEIRAPALDTRTAVLPLLGDPLTASYAIRTLGEIGATDAIPHLRARLTVPDIELRAAAPQALGLLQDVESKATLTERLQDANEALDVRVGAAFGLLCLGQTPEAETFLAEREAKGDYHAPTLARLRERLAQVQR
ncbi:MAG TPA: HEAT repeat domain-containing protein [Planctomycetota bacterium]